MKSIRNSKGFSLVELMVVVAIIGVLAAIAVPQYQRFTAKSKQSEAKSNLSALYSTQRAFYSEWQDFSPRFTVTGFSPTGLLKYSVRNAAAAASPATINGYTGPIGAAGDNVTTNGSYCMNAVNRTLANAANYCQENVTYAAAPVGAVPAVSAYNAAVDTFTATASSNLGGNAVDTWTINQSKVTANPTDGIAGL